MKRRRARSANPPIIAPAECLPPPANALEVLGLSPSAEKILRFFLLRPRTQVHGRKLQRLLGLGGRSLQRELTRLVIVGALERIEHGRLVHFRARSDAPLWKAFRVMLAGYAEPASLVCDALRDVSGIQAAFVFGSIANATHTEDSDIDLLLVEDTSVDSKLLHTQLAEVGLVLNREVNTIRYSAQALAERLGDSDHAASHFVREVLQGPKRWVAGREEAIRPIATAAGISLAQLAGAPA